MGDEIPMRSLNFILILACVTSFAFAENTRLDKARFDAMFNTLDNPRTGLSDEKISSLKNPFGFKKRDDTSANSIGAVGLGYKLIGTMGDKAKINDRWYGLGDNIGSYKITKINEDSVIIANEYNDVEIKINQGNNNVIITYK